MIFKEKEEDLMNLLENSEENSQNSEENKQSNSDDSLEIREDLDESGILEQLMTYNQPASKKDPSSTKPMSQKPLQTGKNSFFSIFRKFVFFLKFSRFDHKMLFSLENDLYEADISRKIVLFPLIVDIDMIVNFMFFAA